MLTRSEWRWLLLASALIALLALVPFFYAHFAAPPESVFGGFILNTLDGNSYLAKMYQGYNGSWLYRLAFTPEEQKGIFTFSLYLALGHLARLTSLPLIFLFHFARVLTGIFLLITTYLFTARLTQNFFARRCSFLSVAFGSGLALLSLLLGRNTPDQFTPLDLFVPEAFGFYSILVNPHFPLVFALQAWLVILLLDPPPIKLIYQLILIVFASATVISLAPYLAPVVGGAVVAGAIFVRPFNRLLFFRLGALFLAMSGLLGYYVFALAADPFINEWSRQNITLTPPPLDLLLGLGIWLPLAIGGITLVKRSPLVWALIAWLLLIACAIYFPYPLQRRFLGGVFIPLSIFAGLALDWLWAQLPRWRGALIILLLLGISTNVLLFVSLFRAPSAPELYLKNDEVLALRWLATQVQPTDVVLADKRLGNLIPAWTGARVIYGHPMESFDGINRKLEIESYFAKNDLTILARYPIKFIFGGTQPAGWRLVYQSGEVNIYAR